MEDKVDPYLSLNPANPIMTCLLVVHSSVEIMWLCAWTMYSKDPFRYKTLLLIFDFRAKPYGNAILCWGCGWSWRRLRVCIHTWSWPCFDHTGTAFGVYKVLFDVFLLTRLASPQGLPGRRGLRSCGPSWLAGWMGLARPEQLARTCLRHVMNESGYLLSLL